MKDYLRANKYIKSVHEKREIFKIRTRMIEISENFKNRYKSMNCQMGCKSVEDIKHVLECKIIGNEEKCDIDLIYNGNIKEIIENSKIITKIMKKENKMVRKQ